MKYPKFVPVKIVMEDGNSRFGGIYVRQSQRVIDVLTDDRGFVPFQTRERTVLLNKSKIWRSTF